MFHLPWVLHCDSTGLYQNFPGSPLSLAALMNSLRSDVKVSSISWKSEWTLAQPTIVEAGTTGRLDATLPCSCSHVLVAFFPVPSHRQCSMKPKPSWGGGRVEQETAASHVSCGVFSVAAGSCRAWFFCQTVSCISSSKASSQCPRLKPVSRAGAP